MAETFGPLLASQEFVKYPATLVGLSTPMIHVMDYEPTREHCHALDWFLHVVFREEYGTLTLPL